MSFSIEQFMEVCQAFPRPPQGFQTLLMSIQCGIFILKTVWAGSRAKLFELKRQTPYVMLEGFAHILQSV
jgi:hypothetical protein